VDARLFRPCLDDLGPWRPWTLESGEVEQIHGAVRSAARRASEDLQSLYGAAARTYGAAELLEASAAARPDEDAGFDLARAIAALDYYGHRTAPPRPSVGALTNPTNRRIWERLRPYLRERLALALEENLRESLLWRAVLSRVPENWLPAEPIRQALERRLRGMEPFTRVAVELDLKPPTLGGAAWIGARMAEQLALLRAELSARRPVLLERITDPEAPPVAAEFLVAYALRADGEGRASILCYDPAAGPRPRELPLSSAGRDGRTPPGAASLQVFRCWRLRPTAPPIFGWRRYAGAVLRWRPLWLASRWLRLHAGAACRAAERAPTPAPASDGPDSSRLEAL